MFFNFYITGKAMELRQLYIHAVKIMSGFGMGLLHSWVTIVLLGGLLQIQHNFVGSELAQV